MFEIPIDVQFDVRSGVRFDPDDGGDPARASAPSNRLGDSFVKLSRRS
ncbi:hypothetical protein [Arthrobacter sp. B1805]|nr:hypothetical protein [Arthrobacter sp. B1805]